MSNEENQNGNFVRWVWRENIGSEIGRRSSKIRLD
jgi:hypothetical protein